MATAVVDATGSPGAPIVVRDFQLREPIRIPDAAELKLTASGEAGRELHVGLFAHRAGEGRTFARRPSYAGYVTAGGDPAPALAAARPAPQASAAPQLPIALGEFYASYTFHGPRMRAVQSIEQLSPTGIVGWVKTSVPGDLVRTPSREGWTIDPLALDGAFQLAAYWAWTQLGRAGVPVGIEAPAAQPDAAEARAPVAPPAPAVPAATRADESTWRIEQFPEVQELEQRLALATAFGLKNPYFNVHERVTNDTSVIGGRTVI